MRKPASWTLDVVLLRELKNMSLDTMIPQSRLVDKAIRELLDKYKKEEK